MTGIKRYADGLDLNFSTAAEMHLGSRRLGNLSDLSSLCADDDNADLFLATCEKFDV